MTDKNKPVDKDGRKYKVIELPDDGVRCEVPERPNVREQLAYWSVVKSSDAEDPLFMRAWLGAVQLINKWECDYFELDANLDEADDPRIAAAIEAVGMAVFVHLKALEDIPKN